MLINEVCNITGLTKKAIEYYIERRLISPTVLDNGYRDFSDSQVEKIKKISILRKLGISTEEIKTLLEDESGNTLKTIIVKKELDIKREQAKRAILEELARGKSYSEVSAEMQRLENSKTIAEKLLDAFPGYYGRFICLHFARFFNEPIKTSSQQLAYEKIISFLDNAPPLELPEDLQKFLDENTKEFGTEQITAMIENIEKSIEKPDEFFSSNREVLEKYFAWKQSDEYKNSPAYEIKALIKEFNKTSGYYDVFIPALKELSSSYAEYHKQLEDANEKLLAQFPGMEKIND